MKSRITKTAALVLSGGILLQLGGCGTLLFDLIIQQLPALILALLSQSLTGASAA